MRGGVLKSTLVVDNDTTVTVYILTQRCFQSTVLISIVSVLEHQLMVTTSQQDMNWHRVRTLQADPRHMTHSHIITSGRDKEQSPVLPDRIRTPQSSTPCHNKVKQCFTCVFGGQKA